MAANHALANYLVQPIGEGSQGAPRIEDLLAESVPSGLQRLSVQGTRALTDELIETLLGLLQVPILDLVVGGWRKYQRIMEAAHRSLVSGPEIVELASHEITSHHEPSVDLVLDGSVVATLHIDIDTSLIIEMLTATISEGRITAIHTGDCALSGQILLNAMRVGAFQGSLNLPLDLDLGTGVQLVKQPS